MNRRRTNTGNSDAARYRREIIQLRSDFGDLLEHLEEVQTGDSWSDDCKQFAADMEKEITRILNGARTPRPRAWGWAE